MGGRHERADDRLGAGLATVRSWMWRERSGGGQRGVGGGGLGAGAAVTVEAHRAPHKGFDSPRLEVRREAWMSIRRVVVEGIGLGMLVERAGAGAATVHG